MCELTRSLAQVLHPILRCCVGRRPPRRRTHIRGSHAPLGRCLGCKSEIVRKEKSSSKVPLQHTPMRQRQCRRHRCVLENSMLECANTMLEGTMTQKCERQKCKMHKQDAAQFSPNTMCFHRSGAHTMSQSGRLVWIQCVSVWVHLCRLRRRQFQHNNVVWDATAAETIFKFTAGISSTVFQSIGKSTPQSSCRQGSSTLVSMLQQSLNA